MKKINNIYQKIITIYLILVLISIFINSILVTFKYITIDTYSTILTAFGFVGLLIYIYGLIFKKIKYDYLDFLMLILILLNIISTIFAVNKEVSIWGYLGREEGLLVLITYYLLFLIAKNIEEKNKKKIIYTILILGSLQVIYGIIQTINYQYHFFETRKDLTYAYGFVGNSNFFGSLMCLCYGLNIGISMLNKKIKWYDISLIFFFSLGVLLSGCMSAIVGVISIYLLIIFIIIYNVIKKNKNHLLYLKRFIIIVIVFLISYFVCTNYLFETITNDVNEVFVQTKTIVTEKEADSSYGSYRFYIWENTLKEVSKYIFNGVGIDNFAYAFDGNQLFMRDSTIYFDKAHNEYLQILITEGLPALIIHLIILLVAFFRNTIKIYSINDNLRLASLFAFFAYIAQAFFNISITRVAPIFWIIMGLLINKNVKNKKIDRKSIA